MDEKQEAKKKERVRWYEQSLYSVSFNSPIVVLTHLSDILESCMLEQLGDELQQEEFHMAHSQNATSIFMTLIEDIEETGITIDQIDLLIEVGFIQLFDGNALTTPLALKL